MSIHQMNVNISPDSDFYKGDIKYIKPGNKLRLLDNRRTPGIITNYFSDSAMFRWQILDFEDKGKYWDIPAEDVINYQFEVDCGTLNKEEVKEINNKIDIFRKELIIRASKKNYIDTEINIEEIKVKIIKWLKSESIFFKEKLKIDFSSLHGPKYLSQDLVNYMRKEGLAEQEEQTAKNQVLNPYSGEWMKGQYIVLAELGLVDYIGKIARTKDIFMGVGKKELRVKYILNRVAFIRAYFEVLNIFEIELYRGMSSNKEWGENKSTPLVSYTFNKGVAESFFKCGEQSRHAYLLKQTISVKKLFMTYLETSAMNRQYLEAEALVLSDNNYSKLW